MESFLSLFSTLQGVVAIVVFFGGSIFVHELGHFLAARFRRIRVTRFSIGFGPRIFTWVSSRSGVEYCLSLLPLGGYVAVPDLAEMKEIEGGFGGSVPAGANFKKPEEITYFDRVIVLAAGAAFNVLLAVILAFVAWCVPVETPERADLPVVGNVEKTLEVEPGVFAEGPAFAAGIEVFDKITAVDGVPVNDASGILTEVAFGTRRDEAGNPLLTLTVENASGTRDVVLKPLLVATNSRVGDRIRSIGLETLSEFFVVPAKGMPADRAGLVAGDEILKIDGQRVGNVSHLTGILRSRDARAAVPVEFLRDGEVKTALIEPVPVKRAADVLEALVDVSGKVQKIRLIETPADLDNTAFSAPRETLRTAFAGTENFPVGTVLDGVSVGADAKIVPVKNLRELSEIFAGTPFVKFFVTFADGSSSVVAGTVASSEFKPGAEEAFVGVGFGQKKRVSHVSAFKLLRRSVDITFKSLAGLVNPKSDIGVGHMNGVFSIGEVYYRFSQSLFLLLSLTVMININLAILNLLPVPVLDGGHILMATIGKIRGRAISQKVQNGIMLFFMLLLFAFMGYILSNDWSRVQGNLDKKQAEKLEVFTVTADYLKLISGAEKP